MVSRILSVFVSGIITIQVVPLSHIGRCLLLDFMPDGLMNLFLVRMLMPG